MLSSSCCWWRFSFYLLCWLLTLVWYVKGFFYLNLCALQHYFFFYLKTYSISIIIGGWAIYIYIYLCTHSVSVYVNHEVSKNQCCSTVFAQTFASNVSRQPKPCNKAGVSHLLGDFAKFNVANMRIDPHVPVIYRVVHANGFTTSSCFQISCGRNFPTKLAGSLGRMRFVALVPARGGSDYQRMRGDTHTSWKRVTLAVPFPELRWSCAAQSNCGRLCFNSLEEHQGGLQCCCLSIQFYAAQTDITMQDVIHVRCRSSVGTKSIAFILWSMNHNTWQYIYVDYVARIAGSVFKTHRFGYCNSIIMRTIECKVWTQLKHFVSWTHHGDPVWTHIFHVLGWRPRIRQNTMAWKCHCCSFNSWLLVSRLQRKCWWTMLSPYFVWVTCYLRPFQGKLASWTDPLWWKSTRRTEIN